MKDLSVGSVTSRDVRITEQQLSAIYKVFDKWAAHEYDLLDSNCIDFMEDVVKAAGFEPPPRTGLNILPSVYVNSLSQSIDAQLILRQEQQKTAVAEKARDDAVAAKEEAENARRREEVARKKAEAEKRAAEVARQKAEIAQQQAEANAIPIGWIACTCPGVHSAHGKVVNGQRYHSPAVGLCP